MSRGVSEWGGAVIATGGAVRRADKAVRQTANSERAGGDVCPSHTEKIIMRQRVSGFART